ncbi:hypothetical protein TRFO_20145 [Tritrichomonas foetus]|uniref:Uncharacterized protein n=1 Tax=Tritrichomonas foetus TaxID=1144522 RepID=A0A1J4KL21_9EUKA|nr:hypothetical protein TRFO_20145 [Tritrichomonas foetus]|eukprot:OHT10484.1 hypothetical protein TRFO_20145 [Tritrichomonas foetus]
MLCKKGCLEIDKFHKFTKTVINFRNIKMYYALGTTVDPVKIDDPNCQAAFISESNETQLKAAHLKLISFMRRKLRLEMNSFAHTPKLDAPPINVLISAKVEKFDEKSFRFFLTTFEGKTPNILSEYFDKLVVNIGDQHFEWTRNIEGLELDGVEFILKNPSFPIKVSYALYPDFPVSYFIVPDDLRAITKSNYDCLAKIVKSVSHYAETQQLIEGNTLTCDNALKSAFNLETIPLNQLPMEVRSHLLPLHPIVANFVIDKDKPRHNINVKLPDFKYLPQSDSPLFSNDILAELTKFAELKENIELLSAIARNPFEAIEAEIAGHASYCELSDEANDKGPCISVDQMNPARRSTPFYWQAWTSDYAARFLEENKQIHSRYPSKK